MKLITKFLCVLPGIALDSTAMTSCLLLRYVYQSPYRIRIGVSNLLRICSQVVLSPFIWHPVFGSFLSNFHLRMALDFSLVHKTQCKCTNTDQKKLLYVEIFFMGSNLFLIALLLVFRGHAVRHSHPDLKRLFWWFSLLDYDLLSIYL